MLNNCNIKNECVLLPESKKNKGLIVLSYTEIDTEPLPYIAESEISTNNFFIQQTHSPSESTNTSYDQI